MKVKVVVTQSCLTLCNPLDYRPLGSSVHGIFQAKILEWETISYFKGSSHLGMEPGSPVLQPDSLPSELLENPVLYIIYIIYIYIWI